MPRNQEPKYAENHGQEDQGMEHTKQSNKKENLEECGEDVRSGEGGQNEGKEGAEASVEDGRPNVPECLDSPLVSGAFVTNKIVSNVGSIVDTETHGDDQVDTRHHVYGQAPEVDESSNIDQGEHHTDEDHNAGGNVLDEEDGGDEHTEQRDEHVAPEFGLDHLVRLPAGILGANGEGAVGEVGLSNNLFDLIHGGDPLRGGTGFQRQPRHKPALA